MKNMPVCVSATTGGAAIIAPHVGKFCGIRNGIDYEIWSPEDNQFLPCSIHPDRFEEVSRH